MNIIARSVAPPVAPQIRSFEAALTSRNTLNSLNTINSVTSAFMVMEMPRPAAANMSLQTGTKKSPWTMYGEARLAAIQVTRSNDHELKVDG